MSGNHTYDVAVVGAGVFGAWTAWHLARRGQRVVLVDGYGAAHSRASSGGESRIIRMGYGADELYTRWSLNSLKQWKEFFARIGREYFRETGVLWLSGPDGSRLGETKAVLQKCGVPFLDMERAELERRYPQIAFADVASGILETESGVLMARNAVQALVSDFPGTGATYQMASVVTPASARNASSRLEFLTTTAGEKIAAEQFVFACGAWLAKLFPEILGSRIFPTRQEIFFFGVPAGDTRFAAGHLPTWLFQEDEMYGMPDLDNRGVKIAFDRHGERTDPDTQSRLVSQHMAEAAKAYVARRFPALRDAPIVETRVCQYENTSNGDFLVDRHPEMRNVWFVGGGSGHGFKHGPAMGEYVAGQMLDGVAGEPRFLLETKASSQQRTVY
ncbi:MAG TPA: FAD-dependent oxidoreductase [Candidatus Saccharimonadales bacterium]|nr:FAD-dependent oxidoreductase [Candidatus Saccharimonadales bacterium]